MTQSQDGYPGQADLPDGATDFNQMAFQIEMALGRVRTAVPVTILAVDQAAGTVDVKPLVKQMDGGGNTFEHGTVFSIPYVRAQGGKNAVICDPAVGDLGIAIVADRDISSVKANRAEANPGSRRRFSLADSMYLGGMLNGTPEQFVRFNDDGVEVTDRNGNIIKSDASGLSLTDKTGHKMVMSAVGTTFTGPVFFEGAVTAETNLSVTGNMSIGGKVTGVGGSGSIALDVPITTTKSITTTADVVAGTTGLKTHHHVAPVGGGNTGPALP